MVVSFVCVYVYDFRPITEDTRTLFSTAVARTVTAGLSTPLPPELQPELLFSCEHQLCTLYPGKCLLDTAGAWPEQVPDEAFQLIIILCELSTQESPKAETSHALL